MQIDRKTDKNTDRWTQHLIYGGIEDRQADKQTKVRTYGQITSKNRQKYRHKIKLYRITVKQGSQTQTSWRAALD
jgi:hypothetical protein